MSQATTSGLEPPQAQGTPTARHRTQTCPQQSWNNPAPCSGQPFRDLGNKALQNPALPHSLLCLQRDHGASLAIAARHTPALDVVGAGRGLAFWVQATECLIPALPPWIRHALASLQSTVKTFCGTEPPLQLFPCSPLSPLYFTMSAGPVARTPASPHLSPRLSLHLSPRCWPSLAAPSLWPWPVLLPSPIRNGRWHRTLRRPFSTSRLLDITHPHLSHSHHGLWAPGTHSARKFPSPHHPSPLLPAPERRPHPVPGNVRIPQTVCLEAEKGGRGPEEWLPPPAPACSPGLHTASGAIHLSVCGCGSNYKIGAQSLFLSKQAPDCHHRPRKALPGWGGARCLSHCVHLPTAPACRHWGPGGAEGTGSKPRGKTSWRGRAGTRSLSGAAPSRHRSAREHSPLLPGQALPLPFSPPPITSLVPETHSVNREVTVTQLLKLWWRSLCAPNVGEGAKGWGRWEPVFPEGARGHFTAKRERRACWAEEPSLSKGRRADLSGVEETARGALSLVPLGVWRRE